MSYRKVKTDVYSVGVIDWDRRLFDELIPLPGGTSYNAYFVQGSEANALIDTVEEDYAEELLNNLEKLGVETIDYIISNHSEQDHSGSLPEVMAAYPEARVIATSKGKDMLIKLLHLDSERIDIVADGDSISLGNKNLQFIETPWVHWPETMSTYLPEEEILFSCDFFGSHLATSDLFVENENEVYPAAKRYYAQIMMPFRQIITKNLDKVEKLDLDIIATSHGPIYDRPEFIIEAYRDWVDGPAKPEVVIPYLSMHGSTAELIDYFVDQLMQKNIKVEPFNLRDVELGQLAMALVDAAVVVVGSPTVLGGPHPNVLYAVSLANALKPKTEFASVIGSQGWGGNLIKDIVNSLGNLDVDILDPVLSEGKGLEADFAEIDRLVEDVEKALEKYEG
ncbi:MAG: FprA family A-type flavoprotein [Bacillota bacterium]